MGLKKKARKFLEEFKGKSYSFGKGNLKKTGKYAGEFGERVLLVGNTPHLGEAFEEILGSFRKHDLETAGADVVRGAGQNTPREDVYRLANYIFHYRPDCLVAVGGGSTIDALKAANILAALAEESMDIEDYFGTGIVTGLLEKYGTKLLPMVAVQTNASSGSHLTKYSNVTDTGTGQKKLIVDEAIIPDRAVFDYTVTSTTPLEVSLDGAMDGISHCLEVFYGARSENFGKIEEVALTGIELIIRSAVRLTSDPGDMDTREEIGLGTDLGGYSIMIGGTNGGHLTSFSLVDVTSHGRACGLMNPYYTVLFAPAIEPQLRLVGEILARYGYIRDPLCRSQGRELGLMVAEGLIAFAQNLGFPTTLSELEGFSEKHIERALQAAKNPQLKMKLENMPIPMKPEEVDEYMGSVLNAAVRGDLDMIRALQAR
ncbi:MAG: iron-containing alcohol dehydrogenase [Synergistales bacterium]|nr:iron-containing alcohol dehydrogenase [Synergistales bacterium]